MFKLSQVNALVSGRKSEHEKFIGDLYKIIQKEDLFDGMVRSYKPFDEENGEKLPTEQKKVQRAVGEVLELAIQKWTDLWDMVSTQDAGNTLARSDVIVNGKVILKNVPVTTLLFLEKQVNDLETFVSHLPTPDPAEEWTLDTNSGLLKTAASQNTRTKKIPRVLVKAEATDKFPAQTEVYHEDVVTGYWNKIRYSGTLPVQKKNEFLLRVKQVKDAVKMAREQANVLSVEKQSVGKEIFEFVFST